MSAVAALAALTLGVAGTTAAQATEHRETAAAAPVTATDDWGPEFEFSSHEAFVSYLDSAEGQQLLREEGLTQAEITAVYAGDDVAANGFLDKLKKKALKKAFKALPDSWQKKLTDWAKKGKGYFKEKWNSLPGWVKKALTLGGAISVKTAIEWLIDIIL
ncbi:hypothetical protein [Streptomyces sp. NPDC007904]|jgi:hypothetical protein|uniref:hypothetical protein n=1 Tax=Streptomyces sp. NPDC007904 TaxID=3364787 RepID=UPI0036E53BA4